MAATLHSFMDIFGSTFGEKEEAVQLNKIVIPMIQRDYAQGRINPEVTRVRNRFLESLYKAATEKPEYEHSLYSFELCDIDMLRNLFTTYEKEAERILELGVVLPAYDYALKCSHTFNVLDARGAISVSERAVYISRVRNLARKVAVKYLEQRKEMGYPLLKEVKNA